MCPHVRGIVDNGYVMEQLCQQQLQYSHLVTVQDILRSHVWNQYDQLCDTTQNWPEKFTPHYALPVPDWIAREPLSCAHGDPTLANVMFRPDSGEMVLCDPVPANIIPPLPSVDRGKMLQSLMGWENVLHSGCVRGDAEDVFDILTAKWTLEDLSRAAWWCMVHAMRISLREAKQGSDPYIQSWCRAVVGRLENAVCV